jgi:hypothetical protein
MIRLLLRAYSLPLTLPEVLLYLVALLTVIFCTLALLVSHLTPTSHPATQAERESFARTYGVDPLCEWGDKYDPDCPP